MLPREKQNKRTSKKAQIILLILIIVLILTAAAIALRQSAILSDFIPVTQKDNTASVTKNSSSSRRSDNTLSNALPNVDINSWELTLVNAEHNLPVDFECQTAALSNGMSFDSRAAGYLEEMLDAAAEDGYDLMICSAYRTIDFQSELFESQIAQEQNNGYDYEDAVKAAKTQVAYPGTSEHNLGLAADIVTPSYQRLDDGYAETAEAHWLKENCARFGFILRYPEDKQDITGVIYEPWHFRYVGGEAAAYMMDNNLCLEEFLALY